MVTGAGMLLSTLLFLGSSFLVANAVGKERALMRKDENQHLEHSGVAVSTAGELATLGDASSSTASASGVLGEASNCKPYPGRRVVLVTVDLMYVDFFENWLLSAERHVKSDSEKIVVIAEERAAQPLLERLRYGPGKDSPRFDLVEDEPDTKFLLALGDVAVDAGRDDATPYGTDGFASLVNRRAKRITRYLEKGCPVLYVDVDTVWLKNPLADLDAAGLHDLYLTEDLGASEVSKRHSCKPDDQPNYCTCFIYARPTEAAIATIRQWMVSSAKNGDSKALAQPQFNSALCAQHKTVKYFVLPRDRYPSGGALTSHLEKTELFGTTGPTVVHANYRIGHAAKKDFLLQNGLWNLQNGT